MTTETENKIKLDRNFTYVKISKVHGFGLFAKNTIPKGTRILEYEGERILKENLMEDLMAGLTTFRYIMNLSETTVVDAERGGNDARFINHSCNPNCIVYFFNDIPYIYALEEILIGKELSFDYQMGTIKPKALTEQQKKDILPCNCGSINCKGTLLSN